MLSQANQAAASLGAAEYSNFALARGVVLIVRDVPQQVRSIPPALNEVGRPLLPAASLKLPLENGGTRIVRVIGNVSGDAMVARIADGPLAPPIDVRIPAEEELPPLNSSLLLNGVEPDGQASFVSALLGPWAALFDLADSPIFVRLARELLTGVAPTPRAANVVAYVVEDIVLLETMVPAAVRFVDAVYHLSASGLNRVTVRPHLADRAEGKQRRLHAVIDSTPTPIEGDLLVLFGPGGMSVRSVANSRRGAPSFVQWLGTSPAAYPRLRENLLLELSKLNDAGKAYALEAQLSNPIAPMRVDGGATMPSAEINTALSGHAGVLVAGWTHDPASLMNTIEVVQPDGSSANILSAARFFPGEIERGANRARVTGFVTIAPHPGGRVPLLQPRFRLKLRSGAQHPLVPPLQTSDPVIARATALRAIPPQHADDQCVSRILAPILAELHAQVMAGIGRPDIIELGPMPSRPAVSVIIPLYKTLDYLRFQVTAFAMDPWIRENAEIIFVLDSPEQAKDVEHILGGLHLLHALPMRLVVMARNGGYARANNTGAATARAPVLAMVNSDVIPLANGWLEELLRHLDRNDTLGAVGPKMLFEDGSIQHAGMFFAPDHRGRWLNHHFNKGMPRNYAPARVSREVPAITGACMVIPAKLFNKVGRFTEDYVIGDYEDSDLCLKIRAEGRSIGYVADVELYHFERKSMTQSADYMRGLAWQYNCWLHQQRWSDQLVALSRQDFAPLAQTHAAIPIRIGVAA